MEKNKPTSAGDFIPPELLCIHCGHRRRVIHSSLCEVCKGDSIRTAIEGQFFTWIPVSARVPDSLRMVLLHVPGFSDDQDICIGCHEAGSWFDQDYFILEGSLTPAHWAELPTHPSI